MTSAAIRASAWEGESVEHWRARWGLPILAVYGRIGSTNDEARRLADAGAPTGTVVMAEEQTAGRGRMGRPWHAPAGVALLLSVVLRLDRPAGDAVTAGSIPLCLGLAVARAVERVAGVRAGIKWPNDIVAPDLRKLAGVLCEGAFTPRGLGYVVGGIGLNVGQAPDDFPPELRPMASSLRLETGREIPRAELAGAILAGILADAPRIGGTIQGATQRAIAARDVLRGKPIAIDDEPAGTAEGIAPDGALRVRDPGGRELRVRNGTVRVLQETTSTPGKTLR